MSRRFYQVRTKSGSVFTFTSKDAEEVVAKLFGMLKEDDIISAVQHGLNETPEGEVLQQMMDRIYEYIQIDDNYGPLEDDNMVMLYDDIINEKKVYRVHVQKIEETFLEREAGSPEEAQKYVESIICEADFPGDSVQPAPKYVVTGVEEVDNG